MFVVTQDYIIVALHDVPSINKKPLTNDLKNGKFAPYIAGLGEFETRGNRCSNMAPRLSGQTSIFGVAFFVSKSLLGIERQKKLETDLQF